MVDHLAQEYQDDARATGAVFFDAAMAEQTRCAFFAGAHALMVLMARHGPEVLGAVQAELAAYFAAEAHPSQHQQAGMAEKRRLQQLHNALASAEADALTLAPPPSP